MSAKKETSPESIVREIKRKTRRKFSAEEKIRIILEGLRGKESIADPGLTEVDDASDAGWTEKPLNNMA